MSYLKSKEELEQRAQKVFKFNSNASMLYATSDGQFFLQNKEYAAQNHSRESGNLNIYKIYRENTTSHIKEDFNIAQLTVAEVEDWAKDQEDIERLTSAKQRCDTKGGKEAISARIKELETKD